MIMINNSSKSWNFLTWLFAAGANIVEISSIPNGGGDIPSYCVFSIEPIKNVNETVNGSHRQLRVRRDTTQLLMHM